MLKLRNERPLSLFEECDEELFAAPLLNERIEGPLFDGALLFDREFELELDRLSPRLLLLLFLSF